MIILDTNVISAVMDVERNHAVLEWFDRQSNSDLFTTAVSLYELRFGIERLKEGAKKQIATRNIRHFQDAGVRLINPWESH